jgi:hypothetical protein
LSKFYSHLVYLWSFGIFCGHLVYFVVIWYILWSFGIFCGHLVYFFPLRYFVPTKKNLATLIITFFILLQ